MNDSTVLGLKMTAVTRPFQRALTEYCGINISAAIHENPIFGNYTRIALGETILAYGVQLQKIITRRVYKIEALFLWISSSFVMY